MGDRSERVGKIENEIEMHRMILRRRIDGSKLSESDQPLQVQASYIDLQRIKSNQIKSNQIVSPRRDG